VSHDLALVRQVADTVSVLHSGVIVESGPAERVLNDPQHDYTRGLLAAVPRPETRVDAEPLARTI